MLYPLSYEGLRCTFAQHAGLGSGRWSWVVTSLPTACAAPVPRAVWPGFKHRLGTWRRLYGGWCRVKNRRSWRGTICGTEPPTARYRRLGMPVAGCEAGYYFPRRRVTLRGGRR